MSDKMDTMERVVRAKALFRIFRECQGDVSVHVRSLGCAATLPRFERASFALSHPSHVISFSPLNIIPSRILADTQTHPHLPIPYPHQHVPYRSRILHLSILSMLRTSTRSLAASSSRSVARIVVPTISRCAQRGLKTCAGVQLARK
jgi:hypothetical protein